MPTGINYLAVLVAGVVIFLLGGLWYSALFTRPWVALQSSEFREKHATSGASPAMFIQVFLCGLITAFVIAVVEHGFATPNLVSGACVGAMLWLIAAATSYGTSLFSFKPRALWAIDTGYNLASMVIAGAIVGAWR